jgi:2,4-dienoyl-CoA reductase (NADPH2)
MMTAIVAAGRGHQVTLFDKAGEVGGQLNLAKRVPGKEEFHGLVGWFATMLDHPNVTLRLGVEAAADDLASYDEVVIATGVTPRDPGIPTETGATVLSYIDVLKGAAVGRRVAVVGAGGIGFDVAETLVQDGVSATLDPALWKTEWGVSTPWENRAGLAPEGPAPHPPAREVILLQRKAEKPGRHLGKTTGWIHRASLAMKRVKMQGGVNYDRITPEGLWISHGPNRERPELLAVDAVVLCAGQEPERGLSAELTRRGVVHHVIGGADVAAELDAKRAIDQAARLAAGL